MISSILNINHKIQSDSKYFLKQKSYDVLGKTKKNKSNYESNIIILLSLECLNPDDMVSKIVKYLLMISIWKLLNK